MKFRLSLEQIAVLMLPALLSTGASSDIGKYGGADPKVITADIGVRLDAGGRLGIQGRTEQGLI